MNGTEPGCREVICHETAFLEVLLSTIRYESFFLFFFFSFLLFSFFLFPSDFKWDDGGTWLDVVEENIASLFFFFFFFFF